MCGLINMKKIRDNPYKIASFVFGILCVFLLIEPLLPYNKVDNCTIDLCNIISGTPAWIISGKIFNYGYKGNISVDSLIEKNVEFYYKEGCGYCQAQIEGFDNWTKYKESGLTKKCK